MLAASDRFRSGFRALSSRPVDSGPFLTLFLSGAVKPLQTTLTFKQRNREYLSQKWTRPALTTNLPFKLE